MNPQPQPAAATQATTAPCGRATGGQPSIMNDTFWLGQRLLKDGSISAEQFNSAQAKFRENPKIGFATVLEQLGLVSPSKAAHLVAATHGLGVADLSVFTVDRVCARSYPENKARQRCLVPFHREGDELHIAVADPTDYTQAHARVDFAGQVTRLFVAPRRDILMAISDAWKEGISLKDPQSLFEALLRKAVAQKASDLHLEPRENALDVRLRVDNRVVHEQFLPLELRDPITQAAKLFGRMDISESRKPQDGQGKMHIGARTYSFRLSCVPCVSGESIVVRVIDENAGVRSFEDIGLFPEDIERLKKLINLPNGVIYVTGPTGSGKTTLLYSCLNQLPATDLKIITIEDPVEFTFPQFIQIPVDDKVGRRFDNTLPFLLRQDPDILLVGETRDLTTARLTIQASLTGHLCFSTLHTNDAVGTITRLTDLGIEPYLIAASVKGLVAQRLVRRLCPQCRTVNESLNEHLCNAHKDLIERAGLTERAKFYTPSPEGCPNCQKRGFTGRLAIIEVYPLDGLERAIADRRPEEDIKASLKARGFRDMREDGILKAALGLTTVEEVLNVV